MGDLTSRYDLYLPGGGSTGLVQPDELVDIDKLNDNLRAIDRALGAREITDVGSYHDDIDGDLVWTAPYHRLYRYQAASSRLDPVQVLGGTRYVGDYADRMLWNDDLAVPEVGMLYYAKDRYADLVFTGTAPDYYDGGVWKDLTLGASMTLVLGGAAKYLLTPTMMYLFVTGFSHGSVSPGVELFTLPTAPTGVVGQKFMVYTQTQPTTPLMATTDAAGKVTLQNSPMASIVYSLPMIGIPRTAV